MVYYFERLQRKLFAKEREGALKRQPETEDICPLWVFFNCPGASDIFV